MEPAQKQAVDQWTRTENLKIILHSHSFLNKCCWENRIFAYIRLKLDSHILLYINQPQDLNVRSGTLIKLIEEKIKQMLQDVNIGSNFRNMLHCLWNKRIDKLYFIKLKQTVQERRQLVKRQPTAGEKIFASYSSLRSLTSSVYKELRKKIPKLSSKAQ